MLEFALDVRMSFNLRIRPVRRWNESTNQYGLSATPECLAIDIGLDSVGALWCLFVHVRMSPSWMPPKLVVNTYWGWNRPSAIPIERCAEACPPAQFDLCVPQTRGF